MLPTSMRHKFNLGLALLLQKPVSYDLIFRQGVLLTAEMRGIACVFLHATGEFNRAFANVKLGLARWDL